jgi:hypothetical protein
VGVVALYEAVLGEVALDGVDGADHTGIVRGKEPDAWDE